MMNQLGVDRDRSGEELDRHEARVVPRTHCCVVAYKICGHGGRSLGPIDNPARFEVPWWGCSAGHDREDGGGRYALEVPGAIPGPGFGQANGALVEGPIQSKTR